jgi:hypothetical protein
MQFFKTVNLLKYRILSRYRKGFSVHSPFVFELLNCVFFEKSSYYCYPKIKAIVEQNFSKRQQHNKLKYYKLIFRLANYFNPKKVLIAGKNSFIEKIFTFVSSKLSVFKIEKVEKIQNLNFDFVFFSENFIEKYDKNLFLSTQNNSVLIFENIYQNSKIYEIWKNIIKDKELIISIDIFGLGIIITKNDIPKQHYRVAF